MPRWLSTVISYSTCTRGIIVNSTLSKLCMWVQWNKEPIGLCWTDNDEIHSCSQSCDTFYRGAAPNNVFFFLYRRIFLYIFASLKCTLHLIAIEITTASYFHFLKILTQYFRRDPFAKNVWVHWLFCHRAISRFFACWPRAEISLYGCGRCGNNDASIKGDRSAAYLWAAAKHNKQDGGRRGELMSSAFISFYPADYTGRWK